MSMRPRTSVRCDVAPRSDTLVRFAIESACTGSHPAWLSPSRKAKQRLREAWETLGLRGAALVFDWVTPEPPSDYGPVRPKLLDATDEAFVVNVLARTRSCLLLGDAPLTLETPFLSRALVTDDPRLIEMARKTGVRRTRNG